MRNITKEMVKIWKMEDVDWLGYQVDRQKSFEFHHLVKREHFGKLEINNGAVLGYSHKYLHIIEYKDLDMYIYLNNILKNINNQRCMPNTQQLLAIDSVLRMFEREHCSDTNAKGRLIIKEEYTKRLIKK